MRVKWLPTYGAAFYWLQAGAAFGTTAAQLTRLCIAWWCLTETASATLFSVLIASSTAAEVWLKPLLSHAGDRINRSRLILFCQAAEAGLVLLLSIVAASGSFSFGLVTAALMLISVIIALREPAMMSILPDIVSDRQLPDAIATRAGLGAIMMMAAPVTAAGLIAMLPASFTLLLAALILFAAGGCSLRVTVRTLRSAQTDMLHTGWLQGTASAFRAFRGVRAELHLALICATVNMIMFPFFTVIMPFRIITELGLPVGWLGAFDASFGAGLIAGSFMLNRWTVRKLGRLYTVLAGFVVLGATVTAILVTGDGRMSVALAFLCGAAFVLINVNLNTVRVIASPPDYLNRLTAMAMFFSRAANPAGVILAGWCLNVPGSIGFAWAGGATVLLTVPLILLSVPLRTALTLSDREMKGFYARTWPRAFIKRSSS